MIKRLCLPVIFIALAGAAFAQGAKLPKFSSYPVKVEKTRITAIDLKKHPEARTYRTRLTDGVKGGVNFAGHYIIIGWGCGTGCTNGSVIDARTGNVIWPVQFYNLDATYGSGYSDEQIEFRKNSRLLIIHGVPGSPDNSPAGHPGDYYYEWKTDRLRQLKFVEKRSE